MKFKCHPRSRSFHSPCRTQCAIKWSYVHLCTLLADATDRKRSRRLFGAGRKSYSGHTVGYSQIPSIDAELWPLIFLTKKKTRGREILQRVEGILSDFLAGGATERGNRAGRRDGARKISFPRRAQRVEEGVRQARHELVELRRA